MNTFKEFIAWLKETRPRLDRVWKEAGEIKGVLEGCSGQEQIYALLIGRMDREKTFYNILPREAVYSRLHPSGDNFCMCMAADLEATLSLLDESDFNILGKEDKKSVGSMWPKIPPIQPHISDFYRLEHKNGLMSLQIFNDPYELDFYLDTKADNTKEKYVASLRKNQEIKETMWIKYLKMSRDKPDFSFNVQTSILINPYGHKDNTSNHLEEDKLMEEKLIQLMEKIIEKKYPALYKAGKSGVPLCIINPPIE